MALCALDIDASFGEPSRVSGRLWHGVDRRSSRPLTWFAEMAHLRPRERQLRFRTVAVVMLAKFR